MPIHNSETKPRRTATLLWCVVLIVSKEFTPKSTLNRLAEKNISVKIMISYLIKASKSNNSSHDVYVLRVTFCKKHAKQKQNDN